MNDARISNFGRRRLAHELWEILTVGSPMKYGSHPGILAATGKHNPELVARLYIYLLKAKIKNGCVLPLSRDEVEDFPDFRLERGELRGGSWANPSAHRAFAIRRSWVEWRIHTHGDRQPRQSRRLHDTSATAPVMIIACANDAESLDRLQERWTRTSLSSGD